tara:strand:- start:422 stop:1063 length:642 start_codon:yes stop_codon:yes gene_type:complete
MPPQIIDYSLYFVTSQEYSSKKSSLDIANLAASGGIDIIQMREKNMPNDELISLGKNISTLCKKSNILFIVNDDPEIAANLNADGVHLGQEDLIKFPIAKTRKIIGQNRIIGVSTHSLEEFKQANELDINYLAFGPIFTTKTKNYSIGTSQIKEVLKIARFPVIFIGGINTVNMEELLKLGAKNIALIREITESNNIADKVRELKNIILKYKG